MIFASVEVGGRWRAGIIRGEDVVDLDAVCAAAGVEPFRSRDCHLVANRSAAAGEFIPALERVLPAAIPIAVRATARFGAPIRYPRKITAIGLNYRDHAAEQKVAPPERPLLFSKCVTALCGPETPIFKPPETEKLDYECELCVIMGVGGYRIPEAEARSHIFGYTILNDVSARDCQFGDKQWYRGKSFPTFAPTGPVIVSADAFDPDAASLGTRVNGQDRQKGSTRDMVFGVYALVAAVSNVTPLEPGDLIATGTPAGVGVFRQPPLFLQPGDIVECWIEGIGTLRNRVEAWTGQRLPG